MANDTEVSFPRRTLGSMVLGIAALVPALLWKWSWGVPGALLAISCTVWVLQMGRTEDRIWAERTCPRCGLGPLKLEPRGTG